MLNIVSCLQENEISFNFKFYNIQKNLKGNLFQVEIFMVLSSQSYLV